MKAFLLLFYCSLLVLVTSCMPDRCGSRLCTNGGVCVDGSCSCLNGYEGTDCDEIWNARFLGGRTSAEQYQGDTVTTRYGIVLVSNGRPDQFLIMNLSGRFDSILCRRKSYREFAIAENQKIDSVTSISSGSGMIDTAGATVIASYTLQLKDTTLSCNMVWEK